LPSNRASSQGKLTSASTAWAAKAPALPAARGRTMAANLPAKEKSAWAKLPSDHEKARFFIDHWRAKIAKFATEEA
jgi:hypothetical protein